VKNKDEERPLIDKGQAQRIRRKNLQNLDSMQSGGRPKGLRADIGFLKRLRTNKDVAS
jgi:hypothetical protein